MEYKGYKGILTLNPKTNWYTINILAPDDSSESGESQVCLCNDIEKAEELFHSKVNMLISYKEFQEKCNEWKSKTDYESVRCVLDILPEEFEQRVNNKMFDNALLDAVRGGNYEVPLYYITKAWDIILKGKLEPIDFKIGPEEEEDCTEADIQEFLIEERAARTRCEACLDNNRMKKIWKKLFNIDIDSLDIDFLQFNMHLPPNVSFEEYDEYFINDVESIDDWILSGINHPDRNFIKHNMVSALMEFTAEVLLRRMNKL